VRTYEQFLEFVSKNFNIEMILWTGDNIDHEVWEQTQATQTVNTYDATQYLKQYFPNTIIYPMFGNHEAFFADQFDTVSNGSAWLTDELGEIWEDLLTPEALNELKTTSYYSTINTAYKLKIISLDTQTCDTLNFELIKDASVDPLNQV
jgi:sphingomyelin phosphodiesterase